MIYLDNSATTFPKPLSVHAAVMQGELHYSFNSGRGGYRSSMRAGEEIYAVREKAACFFHTQSRCVCFTKNCTEALNIAIKSACEPPCHVLMSALEHNSVSRVVHALSRAGKVRYDTFCYSYNDDEILADIRLKLQTDTKVLICTHGSNLSGVVFPIQKIGALCREKGVLFIVDAAQSAGILDIDVMRDNIDVLCAAGHKGLMGAMGTGLLVSSPQIQLKPLLQGGTGSRSFDLVHPNDLPEGFEAGTLNNSGILSLGAGLDYIQHVGRENIYRHEMKLARFLYDALKENSDITLYTEQPVSGKNVGILMFNVKDYPSEKTASLLAKRGICVRGGFHCAPLAHCFYGTQENGAVRVSFGAFNTLQQCRRMADVLTRL